MVQVKKTGQIGSVLICPNQWISGLYRITYTIENGTEILDLPEKELKLHFEQKARLS